MPGPQNSLNWPCIWFSPASVHMTSQGGSYPSPSTPSAPRRTSECEGWLVRRKRKNTWEHGQGLVAIHSMLGTVGPDLQHWWPESRGLHSRHSSTVRQGDWKRSCPGLNAIILYENFNPCFWVTIDSLIAGLASGWVENLLPKEWTP